MSRSEMPTGPGVRVLGQVGPATGSPNRPVHDEALAARARELLREEVARVARMREQLAAEEAAGAPGRAGERLAGMVATVEGATRFALRLGLVSPGEARLIWAEARTLRDAPDEEGPR
jgi:hypothetical protein